MTRRQLLAAAVAAPVAKASLPAGTIDTEGGVIVPPKLFYVEDMGRGIYAIALDEKDQPQGTIRYGSGGKLYYDPTNPNASHSARNPSSKRLG